MAAAVWLTVLSPAAEPRAIVSSAGTGLCNRHYDNSLTFPIPGRGLALSWAPADSSVAGGHAIAVGGHLVGAQTYLPNGERYDTKVFDTSTGQYLERFGVHYWWAVSNTWTRNPYIGEVIADGAGDHAAKIFLAAGQGTNLGPLQDPSARGRYAIEDGALPGIKAVYGSGTPGLPNINGWITSLAFSPDGRYLAGSSRDGTTRLWQIANDINPGDRFRVVKMFYDPNAGNILSVRWSPDGTMLATGDRAGQVRIYAFHPVQTRWDETTIAEFFGVTFDAELSWLAAHLSAVNGYGSPVLTDTPIWERAGLGAVWNVRYAPDGRRLAVAGQGSSLVFDLTTDATFPLLADGHGLDFNPDGRFLALGAGDGHIYVYDATSSSPFALYDVLQGHTEPVVSAVTWSPDGTTLASTAGGPLLGGLLFNQSVEGNDDTVRLWTASETASVTCQTVSTTTTTTLGSSTTSTTYASTTTTPTSSTTSTTSNGQQPGAYPGFGHLTTGGAGHPLFVVTNSSDADPSSLRDALARAARAGGGIIRFNVPDSGDIYPGPNLVVPANTTVDASGSHITLWGGHEGWGNGVLNVWNSNVIVIGLRVRNGLNDGIQVAPKSSPPHDISNIVIDRCSVTGNADGGVDVTGHDSHTVGNITIMRSFVAGSGRYCWKGLCGGGSLFKYGAFNGSYYANFFLANLERAPLISAAGSSGGVVADLRYNAAEGTQASSMSIREGAAANIIGNFFIGPRDGARVWSGAQAYFGGGNTDQNTEPDTSPPFRHLSTALPVPQTPSAFTLADALGAGPLPRDAVDGCYVNMPVRSFASFRASSCTQQ